MEHLDVRKMVEEFIKFLHLRTGYMAPSIHPTEQYFPAAIANALDQTLRSIHF